jgi:predicted DNA binding CopG/RHH family protein
MKKKSVINTDEEMYKENDYSLSDIPRARALLKALKKPTSIALDPETILELKELAETRGIPYQVLMRSYILEGLKRDKKRVG